MRLLALTEIKNIAGGFYELNYMAAGSAALMKMRGGPLTAVGGGSVIGVIWEFYGKEFVLTNLGFKQPNANKYARVDGIGMVLSAVLGAAGVEIVKHALY